MNRLDTGHRDRLVVPNHLLRKIVQDQIIPRLGKNDLVGNGGSRDRQSPANVIPVDRDRKQAAFFELLDAHPVAEGVSSLGFSRECAPRANFQPGASAQAFP